MFTCLAGAIVTLSLGWPLREKDGLWAVLAWLSILAHFNTGTDRGLGARIAKFAPGGHDGQLAMLRLCRWQPDRCCIGASGPLPPWRRWAYMVRHSDLAVTCFS